MKKTMRLPAGRLFAVLLVLAFLPAAYHAWACSVPVFRYALERWEPSPYSVFVIHRGEYSESDLTSIDALRTFQEDGLLQLSEIDLSSTNAPSDEEERIMGYAEKLDLPALLVFFPPDSPVPDKYISADLNPEHVRMIWNSPKREEIARRILSGDTAVWCLLESGNAEADEKTATQVKGILEKLEKEIPLSDMTPEESVEDIPTDSAITVKLAFSLVRISPDDEQEKYFTKMLKEILPEGRKHEAVLFPVFGRGRLLELLIGDQMTSANISDIASYLAGPCSCEVKMQNPGLDLPFAIDWRKLVFEGMPVSETEAPKITLTGFDRFFPPGEPVQKEITPPTGGPEPAAAQTAERSPDGAGTGSVVIKITAAVILGMALLFLLTHVVLSRRKDGDA